MASSEPVNQPAPVAEASKTEAHPAPAGDATTTATKPVEDAAPTPEHQHAELDAAEAAGRSTIIADEAPARATVERAEHDGHHDLQFKQMHADLNAAEAAGRAAIVADEAHAGATMERAEHDGHRDIQVAAEAAARSTIVTDEAEARTAMKRAAEEAGFDAEAAALERELAELAEADPVVQNETESAEAEIKARDELLQTLQSKNDITSEREAKRQDTETQVLAIEARASSREGTIEAAETATALEELFEKARFANMWEVTVSADELATLVSAAPEDGFPPQEAAASLEADKKHHENEVARAEDIQAKGLAAKAERIAKNEALLTQLEQDIDADLRRLNGMKPRLRHALNEQRFHLKRGTHIKASTVARRAKDEFLSLEQAKAEHSKICESINEEDYQITAVTRELDALKREKNHLLKTSAVDKAALLSNIENLNKEVESVAWEQKTLEDENQAMRDMRRDMIRTAAQVRHQLRE